MIGVSIVIPSWNGQELLQEFLTSVISKATDYSRESASPVEILVVDDGSTDSTADWLKSQGFSEIAANSDVVESVASTSDHNRPALRFVSNPKNLGFPAGCNRGIRFAQHPLVLLLNNDVELLPEAINALASNFSDPETFAVHCRVFDKDNGSEIGTGKICSFAKGFLRVHRSYSARTDRPGGQRVGYISAFAGGGASMLDRDKVLELGGFEELLSPFYWEDVELSYRAWKRGYRVLYEPRALARHRVSSTISRLDRARVRRIQQRNRIIYHWINLHDKRLFASHLFWVLFLAVTAPIRLQPGFLISIGQALSKLKAIRVRRATERQASERTDREIFKLFEELENTPGIIAYNGSGSSAVLRDADPALAGNDTRQP